MPRGDGTGPGGMGAMTGWAVGYCAGYDAPGYRYHDAGQGFGGGFRGCGRRGGGRGRMQWSRATGLPGRTPDPELEKQALRHRAEALQSELGALTQRLSSLETGSASD